MSQERMTVRCPECRAKLLVHPSRRRVECPKCGTTSEVVDGVARSLARQTPPESGPATERATQVEAPPKAPDATPGFFRYFADRWDRDRGGVVFKALLGIVSAGALDLAKPVIGHRGMVAALAALASLAAVSFVAYASARTLAYVTGTDRGEEERPRSPLAWIAYFGIIATVFAWGPLVVADYFSPERGWLAALSPALADQQARLRSAPMPGRPPDGRLQGTVTPPGSTRGGPGDQANGQSGGTSRSASGAAEGPPSLARIEDAERARINAEKEALAKKKEQMRAAERTDDPVVARLIENLRDRDAETRAQAAQKLQQMAENLQAQAAVPALIQLIVGDLDGQYDKYTNSQRNKDAAVRALKALAPEKVKTALIQAAESKSKGVRMWAVDWLTRPEDEP